MEFLKKQIKQNNQIFWVCPLIENLQVFRLFVCKKKYELIKKFFLISRIIHGSLEK